MPLKEAKPELRERVQQLLLTARGSGGSGTYRSQRPLLVPAQAEPEESCQRTKSGASEAPPQSELKRKVRAKKAKDRWELLRNKWREVKDSFHIPEPARLPPPMRCCASERALASWAGAGVVLHPEGARPEPEPEPDFHLHPEGARQPDAEQLRSAPLAKTADKELHTRAAGHVSPQLLPSRAPHGAASRELSKEAMAEEPAPLATIVQAPLGVTLGAGPLASEDGSLELPSRHVLAWEGERTLKQLRRASCAPEPPRHELASETGEQTSKVRRASCAADGSQPKMRVRV